ncbi:LysE family translocator [Photobacterium alginatilyticum]|uniref:LysE family translocator n=1 Tax=Photobacterium alginatilyticum TaxID=1775171 RepID=A0ABW9YPR2_9GAMM|nr:LysE family translocator [Photobacterium alginatilyticum]NBI55854.1 LysE family translocator [Photobacterium alginatilyticum]
MTLSVFASLFIVTLLGTMTPGQSVIMVSRNTLAGGRLHGVITACSHAVGVGIYAALSLAGLALTLKSSPVFFNLISYAGAGYLAYLGYCSLRSMGGLSDRITAGKECTLFESARDGFLISLLNPKIIIFFLALFSQFVGYADNFTGRLIIVLLPVILDAVWYSLIACFLSLPNTMERLRKHAVLIDRLSGVVLIGLAVKILTV